MSDRRQSMRRSLRNTFGAALGVLLVSSTAVAAFAPLELDSVHSKVGFTAATVLFDVDGVFEKFSVSIEGDPSKPETVKVEANIEVASLNTNNAKRDKHLKSPDFFDAAKYPMIRFASTGVKMQANHLVVTGNLTMHGVSKLVSIPFKIATGKNSAGVDTTTYKARLTLDRNDYGIGTDSIAAKISLEDEVEVKLLFVTSQ